MFAGAEYWHYKRGHEPYSLAVLQAQWEYLEADRFCAMNSQTAAHLSDTFLNSLFSTRLSRTAIKSNSSSTGGRRASMRLQSLLAVSIACGCAVLGNYQGEVMRCLAGFAWLSKGLLKKYPTPRMP
jgi:hypothetical protein